MQRLLLIFGELYLYNILYALLTKFDRDTDKEVVYPIFSLEIDCARQDLLLVFKYGLSHPDNSIGRGIIGTPGF